MTARTLAHKPRWRRVDGDRRLSCLCGWPGGQILTPGLTTANAFLNHLRDVAARQQEAHRV